MTTSAFPETTRANQHNTSRVPRVLRRAGVAALAVSLLAGSATPAPAAAGQSRPELQQALRDIVDSGLTGVQLRVRDQRGEWTGSAGVRELDQTGKPPSNGRFRIGSNTKTFVATVVLQLAAEGKVGLDTPAAGYLPQYGLDRRITVRMLLQHTSGLFDYTGDLSPEGKYVPGIPWRDKEWVDNRFHTYQPEELIRLALAQPARFAPGTDWGYSNTNYVLAALLIENVTGHSYDQEIQQRIVRPLGLTGTEVPGTRTGIAGPHAHGYYRYQDGGEWKTIDIARQNPSWISAAGEMLSTTQDLQVFFSALMSGKLLPAPLLAEMRTPNPKLGYGLGVFVQDGTTPSPFPSAGCGVTLLTHNGSVNGYGTLMYSTPDGRTTLTASATYVDDAATSKAAVFRSAQQRLVDEVFCGGPATR